MSKKYIFSVITALTLLCVGFNGCTSEKIQVIHNTQVITNNVPVQSFNDENYVWENWTFGTNEVKNIDR